jgi:uncharacterized small protein (DUF1192 family)
MSGAKSMVTSYHRHIEGYSPPHLMQHPFRSSQGNAAVLILVDSRGNFSDRSIVDATMLVAIQHFGFPCRIHDCASGPLSPAELSQSAVIVIAQERLGASLSNSDIEVLASAIRDNDLGLVNFDGELNIYPPSFWDLIGLEIDPIPFASDLIVFSSNDHYITSTQQAGRSLRLKRPVPFSQVKPLDGVTILAHATLGKDQLIFSRHNIPGTAYEPGEYPVILIKSFGKGRIVQFTCSTRLWQREFLGHGMGMDGPFWRAIVWAARKPFIVKMTPPFVTLRVDDAIGRMDFQYVNIFNQHGYHPLISCFIDNIPPRVIPYMRQKYKDNLVDWDAHALDYYHLIPYKFGIGEYSKSELDAIFSQVDGWYAGMDILPPTTAYCHWGEIGVNALPYFKARGRQFLNLTYHAGQVKWERLFPDWWPYGLDSLFYDYIPEDPELYTLGAVLPRHLMSPDVLTGSTLCMGENSGNDINKAAERTALAIHMALDSGFFAEITTHEQKFSVLSLQEIDHWLALLESEIRHYQARLVGHELAAKYTRARDETWLSEVFISKQGSSQVTMIGNPKTTLELAICENDGDGISIHWLPIPDFKGEVKLTL